MRAVGWVGVCVGGAGWVRPHGVGGEDEEEEGVADAQERAHVLSHTHTHTHSLSLSLSLSHSLSLSLPLSPSLSGPSIEPMCCRRGVFSLTREAARKTTRTREVSENGLRPILEEAGSPTDGPGCCRRGGGPLAARGRYPTPPPPLAARGVSSNPSRARICSWSRPRSVHGPSPASLAARDPARGVLAIRKLEKLQTAVSSFGIRAPTSPRRP